MMAKLNALEAASKQKNDDKDLADKAKDQRSADDKKTNDTKALEDALRFEMGCRSLDQN